MDRRSQCRCQKITKCTCPRRFKKLQCTITLNIKWFVGSLVRDTQKVDSLPFIGKIDHHRVVVVRRKSSDIGEEKIDVKRISIGPSHHHHSQSLNNHALISPNLSTTTSESLPNRPPNLKDRFNNVLPRINIPRYSTDDQILDMKQIPRSMFLSRSLEYTIKPRNILNIQLSTESLSESDGINARKTITPYLYTSLSRPNNPISNVMAINHMLN